MASALVTEEAVYHCTGNPMPQDIEQCAKWLLNETIADAFDSAPCPRVPLLVAILHLQNSEWLQHEITLSEVRSLRHIMNLCRI